MASNAVLSSQQSQVNATLTVDEDSTNWTGAITNVQLLPRLGQAQLVRVDIALTNVPDAASVVCTVDVLLRDQAFDEYDIYGGRKDQADKVKDNNAAQGVF